MTADVAIDCARVEVLAVRLADHVRPEDVAVLSDAERDRAARFRFEIHRGRFVSGRAALRRLLGSQLGCAAPEVSFAYGDHGKPSVQGASTPFNVSHSEDVALIAVGHGVGELGVDIELARSGVGGPEIARRFFAPGEVARLLAVDPSERDDAFLRCWTRKEALLKAHGGGLSLPLHDFEVSLETGRPATIVQPGPALAGRAWQLYDVSAAWPGSHAALAVDSDLPVTIALTVSEEAHQ